MNNIDQKSILIILADDLTGAADCAARGFGAGLRSEIRIAPDSIPPHPSTDSPELIALTTDSRHSPPARAAQAVTSAILHQLPHQPLTWYKKIDSTLRGNLGAEVDTMLSMLTRPGSVATMIICPAFPAQGRGLLHGKLVYIARTSSVTDVDAHADQHSNSTASEAASEVDHAPKAARAAVNLLDILCTQSSHPVAHIPLLQVRRGVENLHAAIGAALAQNNPSGPRLIVVDGMREDDLTTIVGATSSIPGAILCGSAGLVAPLARHIVRRRSRAGKMAHPSDAPEIQGAQPRPAPAVASAGAQDRRIHPGAIWIVVGSGSATAHRQIEAARTAGIACFDVLTEIPNWDIAPALALHLPKPEPDAPLEGDGARLYAVRLAETVAQGLAAHTPAALIVVGGDTAQQTLSRLGLKRLRVLAEIQPGMPLACNADADIAVAPRTQPRMILKAGNHGGTSTLVDLVRWIQARQD